MRLRERTTEDTEYTKKTDKEKSLSIAAGKILDRASILGILYFVSVSSVVHSLRDSKSPRTIFVG
jgi:hypothetical protein